MTEQPTERKCPFCSCALDGVSPDQSGEYSCSKCGSTGRYEGENLVAINIPDFYMMLKEWENMEKEITEDIELESMRGGRRDLFYMQEKVQERQRTQSQLAFLSNFRSLVDKW